MTNGVRNKLTPFYLKFFAARTITECEYQAIKLADHTHASSSALSAGEIFTASGTAATLSQISSTRQMRSCTGSSRMSAIEILFMLDIVPFFEKRANTVTANYASYDSSRLFRQDLARAGRISAGNLWRAATTMWFLPRVQYAAGLPHRWRAGGAAAHPCDPALSIRRRQSSRAVPRACEIGRASWRERVEMSGGAVSLKNHR